MESAVSVSEYGLTMSRMGSAKSLEWKHVFVLGLFEGNFPNPWFVRNDSDEQKVRYFNESMKAMYVAATRARESLHLSYPLFNQFGYKVNPSRYLFI